MMAIYIELYQSALSMEQRWKVQLLIESEGDPTACICCGKVWWLLCVCVCVCVHVLL